MTIKTQVVKNSYGKFQDWTIVQVGKMEFKVSTILADGTRRGQSFTTLARAGKYLAAQGEFFEYA